MQVLGVGGFNSWRFNQPSLYFFDVASNPAQPKFIKSVTPVKGAVADDLIRLPNGGFLVRTTSDGCTHCDVPASHCMPAPGLCQNRAAGTFLLMLTPQACLCCLDAATLPQPLTPQVSLMGNKQGELQLHQQLLRALLPACTCHSHSHSTCCTPSKSAATAHAHAQQAESRLTAHAHMQLEATQVLNVACLPPQEGPLAGWQSLMQTSTLSLSILALKRTLRTSVSVLAPCRLHDCKSSTLCSCLLPCMQSGWQHKAECHIL